MHLHAHPANTMRYSTCNSQCSHTSSVDPSSRALCHTNCFNTLCSPPKTFIGCSLCLQVWFSQQGESKARLDCRRRILGILPIKYSPTSLTPKCHIRLKIEAVKFILHPNIPIENMWVTSFASNYEAIYSMMESIQGRKVHFPMKKPSVEHMKNMWF